MKRNPTLPTAMLSLLAVATAAAGGAHRPAGLTREVEAVLGKMIDAYRCADIYQDAGRITVVQDTGRVRQITKMPSETTFARPGKLHVLGGMQSVACDGEEIQIVLDALQQFRQRPAPKKLTMGHVRMGAPGAGLDEGYPEVLEFLLGDKVLERWTSQMREIAISNQDEPAVVAGCECITVSYETIHNASINLFIDAESHLLLRCDIDNTRAQQSPNAPPQSEPLPTLQVVLQLDPVRVDVPVAEDAFALADPAARGMRQVDAFEATAPQIASGAERSAEAPNNSPSPHKP